MRRTKEDAAATAQNILRAAEPLFLEKGYDGVSLDEIAAEANVTRGAVHWHFKNKMGVLLELRSQAQEPFRKLAEDFERDEGEVSVQTVTDLLDTMFGELEKNTRQRALFRVLFHCDLAEVQDDRSSAFYHEMRSIMLTIFRTLEKHYPIKKPWDSISGAATFSAIIGGLILDWAMERPDFKLAPDGTRMLAHILNMLFPDKTA